MEKEPIFLLIIFSFFLQKHIAGANHDCSPASCGPYGLNVRFPFRLLDRQPAKCGFPGFDLSCDEQNQTIIQLPSSPSYVVKEISYTEQFIYIDPEFCRPNRIVDVNVIDTPFSSSDHLMQSYTFYNCSKNFSSTYPEAMFPCISSENYSVIAIQTFDYPGYVPTNCKIMKTISVPIQRYGNILDAFELTWFTPYCKSCEGNGDVCEWNDDERQIRCVESSPGKGISRKVIYGLSIGIGLPALICIIGFAYYAFHKLKGLNDTHNQSINPSGAHNQSINPPGAGNIPQPASRAGLDELTIESYPKTIFGESFRLPNDDGTCAICLSDYRSKESLRTIPECNHYFHSECIDEWLKLNATCPVCRNTPESSTLVTPCYSFATSRSIRSS